MGQKTNVAQRTLYDIWDGNSYTVRKLADGNCWMTDNLALGSTEQTYTLTSADTNLPDGETFTLPIVSAFGTNDWDGGTLTDYHPSVRINNVEHPEFGHLYSWPAAIAGQDVEEAPNALAKGSICPRGWILPGKATIDLNVVPTIYDLYVAYDIPIGYPATISKAQFDRMIESPVNLTLAGEVQAADNYYTRNVGVRSILWMRRRTHHTEGGYTYINSAARSYLSIDNGNPRVNPQGIQYARDGVSVRCTMAAS